MQKRTRSALARRGWLALLGPGLGVFVTPTLADVYEASTDVLFSSAHEIGAEFSLPKYSGSGTITGVTLTLSGSAQGTKYFNFFTQDGITVAPFGETWDFQVVGPPVVSGGGLSTVLDAPAPVSFSGISVLPRPGIFGITDVTTQVVSTTFFGSVNLTDFSDYAGSGSNEFFLALLVGPTDTVDALGNVTETIFTSAPEPATWAMLLLGFAGLGWFARQGRSKLTDPRIASNTAP